MKKLLPVFLITIFSTLTFARTSSNDENKPEAGTVLQLNAAYKDDLIKVFPNPNNGKFFVEYTINVMETGSFVLTDISGKEMWRRTLTKNKGKLNLDQTTPPGMYLYQLIVNGEVFTIDKLIITK